MNLNVKRCWVCNRSHDHRVECEGMRAKRAAERVRMTASEAAKQLAVVKPTGRRPGEWELTGDLTLTSQGTVLSVTTGGTTTITMPNDGRFIVGNPTVEQKTEPKTVVRSHGSAQAATSGFSLDTSSGQELDAWGAFLGIRRSDREADSGYRERMLDALGGKATREVSRC